MSQELPADSHSESSQTAAPRKRSRWKLRLLLVLCGLCVGTIAAELALRFLRLGQTPIGYQFDEYSGARLMPNQKVWQQREGRALVTTNSQGFRDREHSFEKPAGTFRIAVLGDSYAEALQVDLQDTFWSIMQEELKSCLPDEFQNIEVLNFGVSGYGTAQELQMLRHEVWQYEPDLVLLAFLSANDIRNNSPDLEPTRQRPFFTLEDDRLVLDDSFLQDPVTLRFENSKWLQFKDWLIRHFEICALIYRWRHQGEEQEILKEQYQIEQGLSGNIYMDPPPDEVWSEAWNITERLIEQMHREVSEREVPFVVLSVTSGVVVNPESKPREDLCRELGVDDLFHPDRWLERVGRENGFPVVLLSEKMQKEAEKSGAYYHGFANTRLGTGHWNAEGHRFAGEQVSDLICELKLLQRKSR